MRLLLCSNTGEFSLTKDLVGDDAIPPYAILSHTWKEGQEVIFKDLMDGTGKSKTGYDKIQFCGQQAKRDGLQHFWVDTCCIDRSNNVELQEAINFMFPWYQNVAKCYVYLSDVSTARRKVSDHFSEFTREPAFRESQWFTQGWTLQELLAPVSVDFFSREGKQLGDKRTLER